jgi:hypothetical protein
VFPEPPPDAVAAGADVAAGAEDAAAEGAAGADAADEDVAGVDTVTVEVVEQPAVSAMAARAGVTRAMRPAPMDKIFNLASLETEETFSLKYRAADLGREVPCGPHPDQEQRPGAMSAGPGWALQQWMD